jgi:hypothetical protein
LQIANCKTQNADTIDHIAQRRAARAAQAHVVRSNALRRCNVVLVCEPIRLASLPVDERARPATCAQARELAAAIGHNTKRERQLGKVPRKKRRIIRAAGDSSQATFAMLAEMCMSGIDNQFRIGRQHFCDHFAITAAI